MNHSWEEKDDLIAFLLFKQNASKSAIARAAMIIGCSSESLQMRIKNFTFLQNGTGSMNHSSAKTKKIFDKFKGVL
jgi:hypothetical protein